MNRSRRAIALFGAAVLLLSQSVSRAQVETDGAPSSGAAQPTTQPAVTPTSLPGTEAFIYREGATPMRLFVAKPKAWKQGDRRPAYIFFFGGGFIRGTPDRSIGTAKALNKLGFVGIAPDYRTRERFGTTGLECIADARAAVRWVQDHADELGVDPEKIIVGGSSAGGSLAIWTAIEKTPPGSDPAEAPRAKPAALILFSAPTDVFTSKRAKLFAPHERETSPLQNLDAKMPPVLAFHGDADKTVGYEDAVKLRDALEQSRNEITLVTVPGGDHGFRTQMPEWKQKSDQMVADFVRKLGFVVEEDGK